MTKGALANHQAFWNVTARQLPTRDHKENIKDQSDLLITERNSEAFLSSEALALTEILSGALLSAAVNPLMTTQKTEN